MLYSTLHNRYLRLVACVAGTFIYALSLNLFIVPLSLYSGGILGFCQVLRSVLQIYLHMDFGTYDIAGILYFIVNLPILYLAYRNLGKNTLFKTAVCTVAYSLFYSLIPIPSVPIVDDYLTACLLGGILCGIGMGIILTCGGSTGGLDVIGLCLSKRGSNLSVGKFSLGFNIFLYAACLVLFKPEVALYSLIYNSFTAIILDRMHQQNVNVQALIFTRQNDGELADYIIKSLNRSVTYWNGVGAYTQDHIHVLCVCLSKYEIEELLRAVNTIDPHAFVTIQEGVRVVGNFTRKIG